MDERGDEAGDGATVGLLGPARRALAEAFKRAGALSVAEATRALGQSKTSTRAHLVQMEAQGLIERVERVASSPGRPPLVYALTPRGVALFPGRDREVLTRLLLFLKEQGQGELTRRFLETTWEARLVEYELALAQESGDPARLETRLAALEKVFVEHDFMPQIQRDGATLEVRACNCPFAGVVDATKIPCRLERKLVEHAVGKGCASTSFMFQGHPVCTFAFELGEGEAE